MAAALSGAGLRGSAGGNAPEGAWFLFETAHGAGAFRPVALGGAAQPPPREEDGVGAAGQVEAAEAVLAAAEGALGVAIRPTALGAMPEGLAVTAERSDAGDVVAFVLPAGLAEGLPPSSAAEGAVLHRVRLTAPALGPAEIPTSGDVLVLGPAPICEAAPQRPVGASAFTTTLTAPGSPGGVPVQAPGGGAVVAFEALLTPGQASALRVGEALTLGVGEAPSATYTGGEATRTGTLVAMSGSVWFRFD